MTENKVLAKYKAKRTLETLRRQQVDILSFENFLLSQSIPAHDMFHDLQQWSVVTAEHLMNFKESQFQKGYALKSINVRLATIKAYCRVALEANILSLDECLRIDQIKGFQLSEKQAIDQKRQRTRLGIKKEEAISLSEEQVRQLKQQPDTDQGRRDALLLCLLLDHGLRRSELANLHSNDLNVEAQTLTVHKPLTNEVETLQITKDTFQAARRYLQGISPSSLLFQSIHRGGKIREGMTDRAINKRIREVGRKIGLTTLSPEDCRHYWAISKQHQQRDKEGADW